jgi:hypothetical protein
MVPPLGDVAVTFPDGARLAIEVQFGQITDNELLARRDDFAREGIGLVWVWHPDHQIPRVLFEFGEPGWVFDLAADRMGLACGRAHPGSRPNDIAAGLEAEAASTPARPPWSHLLSRFYWCPQCRYLTGAQLQSRPVPHEIPRPDRMITWADLHPEPGW